MQTKITIRAWNEYPSEHYAFICSIHSLNKWKNTGCSTQIEHCKIDTLQIHEHISYPILFVSCDQKMVWILQESLYIYESIKFTFAELRLPFSFSLSVNKLTLQIW